MWYIPPEHTGEVTHGGREIEMCYRGKKERNKIAWQNRRHSLCMCVLTSRREAEEIAGDSTTLNHIT
jgi:hypothetical protein